MRVPGAQLVILQNAGSRGKENLFAEGDSAVASCLFVFISNDVFLNVSYTISIIYFPIFLIILLFNQILIIDGQS